MRAAKKVVTIAILAGLIGLTGRSLQASSHMDAPLITLDPSANTTDVYAFVTGEGDEKSLVVALGVYPHQEPGIGPNNYNFDDNVLYQIHVALDDDVSAGRPTLSYQFRFTTDFKDTTTVLQSFLGEILEVGDANQNLTQTYTVTRVDRRLPGRIGSVRNQVSTGRKLLLGSGIVPPNNQGNVTPLYNQGNNGENPAKPGVATAAELDPYTAQAIATLDRGYIAFAGQRDDGFFADIQSIFDDFSLRSPGEDSQGGFNIHMMALRIPMSELGGDQQIVGVYGSTSRRQMTVLTPTGNESEGRWVQVARQGNPLFNEGFVGVADKDLYSRSRPTVDNELFRKYAENPQLAALINRAFGGTLPQIVSGRADIAGIFIPDLIKVDLSTPAARLAGAGQNDATNPDDAGFSRLSVFGNDVLLSQVQDPFGLDGLIPGGWPNGRRFGDDVVDIAVNALISDLSVTPPVLNTFAPGDGVDANDISFNKVFPYEGTPQNGRNHDHP